MTTLHLGVIDIPYAGPGYSTPSTTRKSRPSKRPRARGGPISISTGDVAEILEAEYHIMETFYELHEAMIAQEATDSVQDAIDALVMGAPHTLDPFGSVMQTIEARFKQFLSLREMDRLGIPGVPTKAAQMGVSHRFKHPYARRAERPSFIDTGQYQASFKAWVD